MENQLLEKIRHWFAWGDASEIIEFLKTKRIFEFCEDILKDKISSLENEIDNWETENEELEDKNEELKDDNFKLMQKVEKLKKINKLRRAQYINKK